MNIQRKLASTISIISVLSLVLTIVISYYYAKEVFTKEVINHLESVIEVLHQRVEDTKKDDFEKLTIITNKTQLRLRLRDYIRNPKSEYQDIMNHDLRDAKSAVGNYEDIFILTLDGKVLASTDPTQIGTDHSEEEFFIRGQKEKKFICFSKMMMEV